MGTNLCTMDVVHLSPYVPHGEGLSSLYKILCQISLKK